MTNAMFEPIIQELIKNLKQWSPTDTEDWRPVAEFVLEEARLGDDGYDLARHLESEFGIDPDSQLVDILDRGFSYRMRDIERKEFAKTYTGRVPTIGQWVTCKRWAGEVTALNLEKMEVTLFVEKDGHVREGIGTHGHIVPVEQLEFA